MDLMHYMYVILKYVKNVKSAADENDDLNDTRFMCVTHLVRMRPSFPSCLGIISHSVFNPQSSLIQWIISC